jgi:hypothetical protein
VPQPVLIEIVKAKVVEKFYMLYFMPEWNCQFPDSPFLLPFSSAKRSFSGFGLLSRFLELPLEAIISWSALASPQASACFVSCAVLCEWSVLPTQIYTVKDRRLLVALTTSSSSSYYYYSAKCRFWNTMVPP